MICVESFESIEIVKAMKLLKAAGIHGEHIHTVLAPLRGRRALRHGDLWAGAAWQRLSDGRPRLARKALR